MKYTGYRDMNEEKVFIGDTVFSPRWGEFVVRYRMDYGGLVMCPASEDTDQDTRDDAFHDLTYLAGNDFTVVGHGDDHADEINKRIAAVIARKPV
jgi:hypothetical protein